VARPKSIPVREILVKMFSPARLRAMAREAGAFERFRKVDPSILFWTLVLGFGLDRVRTLAGLRRSYEKAARCTLVASSFYKRFTAGLAAMLRQAVADALQSAAGAGRALTGPLAGFRDVLITDSTVVRLHDLLADVFPACRTNHTLAALKMHTVISVAGAGHQSVKVTSERQHDGPVFKVGPWVRGRLLLFDLGYFRYQLFACITRSKGYFLSRLKGNSSPVIVALNRTHRGRAVPVIGERLREVVARLNREILDVMVEVTFPRRTYRGRRHCDRQRLRVVGVRDAASGHYHLYVTNVPVEKLAAEDVSAVYAARWEIEMLFKELKGRYRLEDMPSRKREVVEALLYAAVLTLVVSRRLLDAVRRKLRDLAHRLPERRWAAVFVAVAQELLKLVTRPPREVRDIASEVCAVMLHEAIDPNVDRPNLLRAVETRRHAYRPAAA